MHLPSSNTLVIMAKRMLGLLQPLPCELGRGGVVRASKMIFQNFLLRGLSFFRSEKNTGKRQRQSEKMLFEKPPHSLDL